jgi:peptidoglycan/xylan/chitin deacetylase (PgdA/CDA1 family)
MRTFASAPDFGGHGCPGYGLCVRALLRATAGVLAVASLSACGSVASTGGTHSGAGAAPSSAATATSASGRTLSGGSGTTPGASSTDPGMSSPSSTASSSQGGTEPSAATSQAQVVPVLGVQAPVHYSVRTKDRVVFLTIDDGLFPDPAFLAMVRAQHIPVTVFLTNRVTHAPKALAYFRSLKAAGAVIEDHTLSHPWLTKVDEATRHQEICGAAKRDGIDYGRRAQLLRPPYGAYNASVLATAHACGIRGVVLWNAVMPVKGPLQTTHGKGKLEPGDIVIMHFLPGMASQVAALQKVVAAQHLRLALLENYL